MKVMLMEDINKEDNLAFSLLNTGECTSIELLKGGRFEVSKYLKKIMGIDCYISNQDRYPVYIASHCCSIMKG